MKSLMVLSWDDITILVADMEARIRVRFPKSKKIGVYGVPRGGWNVAQALVSLLPRGYYLQLDASKADIIVDDIVDSGDTKWRYTQVYGDKFFALYEERQESWVKFPWEIGEDGEVPAEDNVRRILQAIGEDVNREGLLDTPKRHMKYLQEFTSPPEFNFTTFQNEGCDEMIVQAGIPFYSLCEHHILPFFGTATVAYIPTDKIVGLSKLARTVEHFARRLQNQERLTKQIAEYLQEHLNPSGVGVIVKARHMCMEMRGVKAHDTYTTTSHLTGYFRNDPATRSEFLSLGK